MTMTPMLRTILFMLLGVSAGFAAATWLGDRSELTPAVTVADSSGAVGGLAYDDLRPLAERVAVLERALDSEIRQREALQLELAALGDQVASAGSEDDDPPPGNDRDDPSDEAFDRAAIQERFAERGGFGRRNDPERRQALLVEAGFSAVEAQRITQRESELQLEALYAQYDAVRSGEPLDPRSRLGTQDQLREELGDASYERYLEATGQPTSVGVRQVMSGSAGATAGLQAGDEIVSYGGERVFDTLDLNRLTLEGSPGEPVVVDVLRDGQQIQVYVPRGPIGITSGGFGGMGGGIR
jgi:hypothetical protein